MSTRTFRHPSGLAERMKVLGGSDMKIRRSRWALLGLVLVGAAVLQEWKKPAGSRTWQGHVLGIIPYDFRPPTWARMKAELWNPADPRIVTPHAFGVGWGVNLYQVNEQLRAALTPGFVPSTQAVGFSDRRSDQ